MIILNILVLLVEALFFYIPLKEIKQVKDFKNKIKLYAGIFLSNIISTLIFGASIFRYMLPFLIIYLIIRNLNKNNKTKNTAYDFFIIPLLFFIKMIIEYITFFFIFKLVNYIIFVIILEIFSILFVVLFKNLYIKVYNIIKDMWNNSSKFYCRYSILIIFNILILFLLYNLMKIKEVLL